MSDLLDLKEYRELFDRIATTIYSWQDEIERVFLEDANKRSDKALAGTIEDFREFLGQFSEYAHEVTKKYWLSNLVIIARKRRLLRR